MSVKKTSALLSFIVAFSLATLSVFIYSKDRAAVAQSVQSSESFGLVGGCQVGSGWIPFDSMCGDKTDITLCSYSQEVCKDVEGGKGNCLPARHDQPVGTLCEAGAGCKAPSYCGTDGNCIPGATVDCSKKNTECQTFGCAQSPGGTCIVTSEAPPVKALCSEVTDPIVCGQKYWVRHVVSSPAKCGGSSQCPADYQLDGPVCPKCACGYLAPPNISWVGVRGRDYGTPFCASMCSKIGATSSLYTQAGYCSCGGVPVTVCPASVDEPWRDTTTWSWTVMSTEPESCRPGGKIKTSCSWASLGTQSYGFTLSQGASPTVLGGVLGTFSYSYGLTDLLPFGVTTVTATFTPSDLALYEGTTCSSSVSISGKKTACVVTASNVPYASPAVLSAQASDAQFSFIPVQGTFSYTIDGSSAISDILINTGKVYTVAATFTPSDYGYEGTTCQGSFTVTKRPVKCTAENQTMRAGGSVPPLTHFCSGFVNGDMQTILGSPALVIDGVTTIAGSAIIKYASGISHTNYEVSTNPGTLTVTDNTKTPTTCQWAQPADLSYGAQLSSKMFDGTDPAGPKGSVPGTYSNFSHSATGLLNVGTYSVTATFSPTDGATYAPSTCTTKVTVNPAAVTCTVLPASRTYGEANPTFDFACPSATVKGVFNTVPVTTATQASGAGPYDITLAQPTTDAAKNYTIKITNGTLTVNKAAASCTADSKTMTVGGTVPALTHTCSGLVNGDNQSIFGSPGLFIEGVTNTAGTPFIRYVVDGITHSNYTVKTNPGKLTVSNKPAATCTITPASPVTYGNATAFNAVGKYGTTVLQGSWLFTITPTTGASWTTPFVSATLDVGTYAISAVFTPSDTTYAASLPCTGTAVVQQSNNASCELAAGSSTVTVYEGTPVSFGAKGYITKASGKTLAEGTFIYNDFNFQDAPVLDNTALAVGSHWIKATFTPKDTNYAPTQCTGMYSVLKKEAVTCRGAQLSRVYKTANPSMTYACTRDSDKASVSIAGATFLSTDLPALTADVRDYTVRFDNNTKPTSTTQTIAWVDGKITVTQADSSCSIGSPTIRTTDSVAYSLFNPTMSPSGLMTYVFSSTGASLSEGAKLAAGTYDIKATLAPTDSVNYKISPWCTGTLTVTQSIECTLNSQCTVDDGNACTTNACCTTIAGCNNGAVQYGKCWNRPITTATGSITSSMQLICPTNGASQGQIKFTWNDVTQCVSTANSSHTFGLKASVAAPIWTPVPRNHEILDTTATRSSCSGGTCTETRSIDAYHFKPLGKAIYGSVALFNNSIYQQHGSTSTTSKCQWCGDGTKNGTEACDGGTSCTSDCRLKTAATCSFGVNPLTVTTNDTVSRSMFQPTQSPAGTMEYRYKGTTNVFPDGIKHPVGTYAITATLRPTDSANYTSTTCETTLVVTATSAPTCNITCPAGTTRNTSTCACDPVPLCGNGILDAGEECDQSAGINGNCLGVGCVNCRRDSSKSCASIFTSSCTGAGSSLAITWGQGLTFQSGTSIYKCHSDPSCCPPVSPPSNSQSQSAAKLCSVSPNSTYGHDFDISSVCPHGKHVKPPSYHISCTCNKARTSQNCLSAVDGVSDSAEYMGEATSDGGSSLPVP